MPNLGFSSGKITTLAAAMPVQNSRPYDVEAKFNRVVERKNDDPSNTVYSIDAKAILKALDQEELSPLYLMTLKGKYVRSGVGIWDTLFNEATQSSLTACILAANKNFGAIPPGRTSYTMQFLNYSMPTSRIHLNQMEAGDRLGIAIDDMMNNLVYVLLYVVDSSCTINSDELGKDGRAALIPSINIRMEHAIRIDSNLEGQEGNMTVVNMEDDNELNSEQALPFVKRLISNVYNVRDGYSWKPHFTVAQTKSIDYKKLTQRLSETIHSDSLERMSYDDFETLCSQLYNSAREKKRNLARNNKKPGNQDKSDRSAPRVSIPMIEVVTLQDRFVASLPSYGSNPSRVVSIDKDDAEENATIETSLLNIDLKGSIVEEVSFVYGLPEDSFGPNAHVRYFFVNF